MDLSPNHDAGMEALWKLVTTAVETIVLDELDLNSCTVRSDFQHPSRSSETRNGCPEEALSSSDMIFEEECIHYHCEAQTNCVTFSQFEILRLEHYRLCVLETLPLL